MTDPAAAEPAFRRATRAASDTVAVAYAELLRDELAARPSDRAAGRRRVPVADLGCGPGRVTEQARLTRVPEPPEKVPQDYVLARRARLAG
jgi:hypothetical protein